MSRKDYEEMCLELDTMRQKDHPRAYDVLSQLEKDVLQYWIEHAIQRAARVDEGHSSYALKQNYEHEVRLYVSHAQFKGAMLMAGFLPSAKEQQHWHFKIKPMYDEPHSSRDGSVEGKQIGVAAYKSVAQGEQESVLQTLVQKVLVQPKGNDTYSVMI